MRRGEMTQAGRTIARSFGIILALEVVLCLKGIALLERSAERLASAPGALDTPRLHHVSQVETWAFVVAGLLAAGVTLSLWRHIERTLIAPLRQILAVLNAAARGDGRRRCSTHDAGSMTELAERTNDLLDHAHPAPPRRELARLDRALLTHVLDREETLALAATHTGEVVFANQVALLWLASSPTPVAERLKPMLTGAGPTQRTMEGNGPHGEPTSDGATAALSAGLSASEIIPGELWFIEGTPPTA